MFKLSFVFLLLSYSAIAQSSFSKNTIYSEIAGPGVIYSFNYERSFNDQISIRAGSSFLWQEQTGDLYDGKIIRLWTFPLTVQRLFRYKSHALEIGIGVSIMYIYIPNSDKVRVSPDAFPLPSHEGLNTRGSGVLGYRFQRPEGGMVFRLGVYPIFTRKNLTYWPGLGLGYAF